mmetsp:Transcript_1046/g.4274  ORF Transcript_1046/g.4274 Transcript_1046/m.4274 type:complete len:270 (-) Transcript_1046:257-1066(-)
MHYSHKYLRRLTAGRSTGDDTVTFMSNGCNKSRVPSKAANSSISFLVHVVRGSLNRRRVELRLALHAIDDAHGCHRALARHEQALELLVRWLLVEGLDALRLRGARGHICEHEELPRVWVRLEEPHGLSLDTLLRYPVRQLERRQELLVLLPPRSDAQIGDEVGAVIVGPDLVVDGGEQAIVLCHDALQVAERLRRGKHHGLRPRRGKDHDRIRVVHDFLPDLGRVPVRANLFQQLAHHRRNSLVLLPDASRPVVQVRRADQGERELDR